MKKVGKLVNIRRSTAKQQFRFLCCIECMLIGVIDSASEIYGPVWARGRCRISPPRFLAECCKRQLNQDSFVLLYFRLFTFSYLY